MVKKKQAWKNSGKKTDRRALAQKQDLQKLQDAANLLRRDSLHITTSAQSGHPTSCLSCAEIISVLFFSEMRFDMSNAQNPDNDEFILSKGHAAPILYAALKRHNLLREPLSNFRKLKGHLEGHPVPSEQEPWIKAATGSLGQGLSIGLGIALAQKKQGKASRTYVLIGDSEAAEGSIYEACQVASFYKVKNLCAILDMNRLGQSRETMLGWNVHALQKRFLSFGWEVFVCDGHSIAELLSAFQKARHSKKPSLIIAKTVKGKGVSFLENKEGWHGRALNEDELALAMKELPSPKFPELKIRAPLKPSKPKEKEKIIFPSLDLNENISTREAYGRALENLIAQDSSILAIDAEVSNSTFTDIIEKFNPDNFVEAFIAEQNMIGMALGLSIKGYHVFASTFSSFLTRAHDQLRMAALSNASMTICGSHAGVSVGPDGASQMGLDDIAMFRDIPNSIILYPSDAISTEKLVKIANSASGIKYIRTTREKTPVIYEKNENFEMGDFKVLRKSDSDSLVLIGAGITLHECLSAHVKLKSHNVRAAVIDLFCIRPLNISKLKHFIKEHGGRVIVVEDHYGPGGIGEMLAHELLNSNIRIKTLHISMVPHSGTSSELLNEYGINARHIALHARSFV